MEDQVDEARPEERLGDGLFDFPQTRPVNHGPLELSTEHTGFPGSEGEPGRAICGCRPASACPWGFGVPWAGALDLRTLHVSLHVHAPVAFRISRRWGVGCVDGEPGSAGAGSSNGDQRENGDGKAHPTAHRTHTSVPSVRQARSLEPWAIRPEQVRVRQPSLGGSWPPAKSRAPASWAGEPSRSTKGWFAPSVVSAGPGYQLQGRGRAESRPSTQGRS